MQIKPRVRYHLIPVRIAIIKKQQRTSVGEDVEKRNLCALLVGMEIGAASMENSMEVPKIIKNRTTVHSTSGYLLKENKNTRLKRLMHSHVYCNIICHSQDMEEI